MEISNLVENHPAFPQPGNPNAKIWRYVEFSKFESLLSTAKLYMARADLLGDEFEGTTPAAEKAASLAAAATATTEAERRTIEYNAAQIAEYAAAFRQMYYVSCWHMNDHENVAMWERYVRGSPESVAIVSSYGALREELTPKAIINLGVVRYIDYDNDRLPSANMLHRITHKRIFFKDEHEVRGVVWAQSHPEIMRDEIEPKLTPDRRGFLQPVNPQRLVLSVVLNPKSSKAFEKTVGDLCARHGLSAPIPSRMSGVAIF